MTYYVIGIGNPGNEYEGTRHNAGHILIDLFARELGATPWKKAPNTKAYIAYAEWGAHTIVLAKTEQYMNSSGEVVARILEGALPQQLVLVHDELDVPIGKFKSGFGRSAAGHKGVLSVIRALKTKDFYRIRIGIAPCTLTGKVKKMPHERVQKYVLGRLTTHEKKRICALFPDIFAVFRSIVFSG